MAVTLTVNGTEYEYPTNRDQGWGTNASGWATAVTTGMLQKAGGTFQLLDEVDFGTAFGLKSLYYKSRTTNPASSGQIRFARADVINWRNQANSANLSLGVNSSNHLTFDGSFGVFTDAFATAAQDGYTILWNQTIGDFQVKPVPATGSGINTVGTINSQTKNNNGLVITGNSIFNQTADATNVGIVSTGTQTFAGAKTFTGNTTVDVLIFDDGTERLRITPGGTNCPIEWDKDISAPLLRQETDTTNSITGNALTIKAQNCTGTNTTGGDLNLSSGSGTTSDGDLNLQADSVTKVRIQPTRLIVPVEGYPLVMEGSNSFLDGTVGNITGDEGGFFTYNLGGEAYPFFSTSDVQGSGYYKRVPLQTFAAAKGGAASVTAATTALNTTNTLTIPADTLQIGSMFRVKYSIRFERGGTATAVSLQVGLNFGGTVIAGPTIATNTTTVTQGFLDCEIFFHVRATGASGAQHTYIKTTSNVGAAAAFGYTAYYNQSTSIDTTVSNIIHGSVAMSAAVADCILETMGGTVEWIQVEAS